MTPNPRVALLTIGDELLAGRIVNTNATWIGQQLHHVGYALDTVCTCHDQRDTIFLHLQQLIRNHDLVLTSGGLGPTTDDCTKEAFLLLCGGENILHQPTLEHIEQLFMRRKRPLNEHNRRQAMVPERCEVLPNRLGTAPAMRFNIDGRKIIALPGVPFEMKTIFSEEVLPWLQQHWPARYLASRTLRTFNIPESRIAEEMEALTGTWPAQVQLAYLPAYDGVRIILQVAAAPGDEVATETFADHCVNDITRIFAHHLYARNEATLPQQVKMLMEKKGLTLAVAESCTAGLIQAKISQVSGVSKVLSGGVVVYSPQAKEMLTGIGSTAVHGAEIYSEATAMAMAEGVRQKLGTDVGLAITGLMEPSTTFPELGMMAAVGVSFHGQCCSWKYDFVHDRISNQERAAYAALFSLYRVLGELEG